MAEYTLFNVKDSKTQPFRVTVQVNGQDLSLEVDTGGTLSLISYETYYRYGSMEVHLQSNIHWLSSEQSGSIPHKPKV